MDKKNILLFILLLVYHFHVISQECTQLGLFAGSFNNPELLELIEQEEPHVIRTFLNDNAIHLMANDPSTMQKFLDNLNHFNQMGMEVVVTIRFPYVCFDGTECDPTQDRIITDPEELNEFLEEAVVFLDSANGKLPYLQVLNEPLGAGGYDSIIAFYHDENVPLQWMDTISRRFRELRDKYAPEIDLISPSVLINGLKNVSTGQTQFFGYKATIKTHEIANNYADALSYHWYPESFEDMEAMIQFADTSSLLALEEGKYRVCTEWSQGHEIKAIFASDTAKWRDLLLPLCQNPDPGDASHYLSIINDSLGIDHSNIWRMYQLMNERNYRFAAYFSLIQGYIDTVNCNIRNYWYALASLYATHLTENGVPNGMIYEEYQNMKDSIAYYCNATSLYHEHKPFSVNIFPNPSTGIIQINVDNAGNTDSGLRIYDLTGRTIYHRRADQAIIHIDLEHEAPGLYIVEIENENQIFRHKIIKR